MHEYIGIVTVGYDIVSTTYTLERQGAINLPITIFHPAFGGAPRPFTLYVSTEDGSAGIYGIF